MESLKKQARRKFADKFKLPAAKAGPSNAAAAAAGVPRPRPNIFSALCSEKGRLLLKNLGLEQFCLEQPIPRLNKPLLDEFVASFDAATGCGIVRGVQVKLDCANVAAATKLPLGSGLSKAEVGLGAVTLDPRVLLREEQIALDEVVFGDNDNPMMKIAAMIMLKLHRRTELGPPTQATLAIIFSLDMSIWWDVKLRWAEYFTRMLLEAVVQKSCGFPFGEWLTLIITNALEGSQRASGEFEASPATPSHPPSGGFEGSPATPVPVHDPARRVEQLEREVVRLRSLVTEGQELVSAILKTKRLKLAA